MRSRRKLTRCRCPKCGVAMSCLAFEGVEVDLCPRCLGMWFDAGELSRAAGLRFDTDPAGKALARAERTTYRCPLCAVPMYRRELDPGSGILAEQCVKCSGLFLDRDEFTRARAHYKSIGAPARAEVNVPQTLFPPVVGSLIVLNTAILVAALLSGLVDWVHALGLVPAEVVSGRHLHTIITSMFMHGGVFHLLGNMYFLYVTGDNVEERLGPWKFLAFYLACGLVATITQVATDIHSAIPMVGASGAISGVLGAYMVLFPHNRFLCRWIFSGGFYYRPIRVEIPAWAYFGFWIALQIVYASLGTPGVAWYAHIGGLACGVVVALCVRDVEGGKRDVIVWKRRRT